MIVKKNITGLAGNMAAGVYLLFTMIAYFQYPKTFTPMTHWLSDLGNPHINPSGALFYNVGCMLTAFLLVVAFFGLGRIATEKRIAKIFLSIACISGVGASVALIISAVFPLGVYTGIHSAASSVLYFGLTYFEAFSATVILIRSGSGKRVGVFGIIAAVETFVFGVFFNVFLGEWITVASFIAYILLISNLRGLEPLECKANRAVTK